MTHLPNHPITQCLSEVSRGAHDRRPVLDRAQIAGLDVGKIGLKDKPRLKGKAEQGLVLDPQFTKSVLEAAETLDGRYKDQTRVQFIVNCHPSGFYSGPGSTALTSIRDRAEALMKEYDSDSLLRSLYKNIRDSIVQMIQGVECNEADIRFENF